MGKCPFCGAKKSTESFNLGAVRAWKCGTNYALRTPLGKKKPEECLFREHKCYETELATLKAKHEELTQIFNSELLINKNLRNDLIVLRTLLQEAMKEWRSCKRGTDAYSINRFENFTNREDVRKVMEE